ncbi:hypothetical protein LY76DRAFT_298420 [Colletotrichum caudatum]|nr:hypothetical protein LY76DRAFT_298420 [Colletotrichum caudatum]
MIGRPAGHVRWAAGKRGVGAFEEACLERLPARTGRTRGRMRAMRCVGCKHVLMTGSLAWISVPERTQPDIQGPRGDAVTRLSWVAVSRPCIEDT